MVRNIDFYTLFYFEFVFTQLVIKWTQNYCENCISNQKNGCVKCINGYLINKVSDIWENDKPSLEVYLLFWFIIIWVIMILFTNYRINSILVFIESLEVMYLKFSFAPIVGDELKIYFSHLSFLSFNIQGCIDLFKNNFNGENNTQFVEKYPEFLIILPVFWIYLSWKLNLPYKLIKIFRNKWFFMIWIYLIIPFITIWAIK